MEQTKTIAEVRVCVSEQRALVFVKVSQCSRYCEYVCRTSLLRLVVATCCSENEIDAAVLLFVNKVGRKLKPYSRPRCEGELADKMSVSVLEELRVFKKVAQKIRSTLVSGREEMVSPTVVSRSFLDSFEKMAPATSLVMNLYLYLEVG